MESPEFSYDPVLKQHMKLQNVDTSNWDKIDQNEHTIGAQKFLKEESYFQHNLTIFFIIAFLYTAIISGVYFYEGNKIPNPNYRWENLSISSIGMGALLMLVLIITWCFEIYSDKSEKNLNSFYIGRIFSYSISLAIGLSILGLGIGLFVVHPWVDAIETFSYIGFANIISSLCLIITVLLIWINQNKSLKNVTNYYNHLLGEINMTENLKAQNMQRSYRTPRRSKYQEPVF